MSNKIINAKDLTEAGWPTGAILESALEIATTLQREGMSKKETLNRLNRVRQAPHNYLCDPQVGPLTKHLMGLTQSPAINNSEPAFKTEAITYRKWGDAFEPNTLAQMDNAASLPIVKAAALMPDGHPGYGLPIGGVVATENAVMPYGVGMDIACRLRLSILDVGPEILQSQHDRLQKALVFNTRFGIGKRDGEWNGPNLRQHAILDDKRWQATPILRGQHDKAVVQLGTSGTSNHFAEWAALTALEDMPQFGLQVGDCHLCFVTHSGSRGVGATIAQEYTRVAKSQHPNLPKQFQQLAWLMLDAEAGQEYWLAMQLSGAFASACHETIHDTVIAAAGLTPIASVENHHNFAWKEEHDGRELIVHRKGATPAAAGQLGVIPGTMADKGYIVVGLGQPDSLNSSSHGAGRSRSRTESKNSITRSQRDAYLRQRGVELLNPDAGVDEAPQAYKDPAVVMAQQQDLVRPLATFMPLMVMMASDDKFGKKKRKKGRRR